MHDAYHGYSRVRVYTYNRNILLLGRIPLPFYFASLNLVRDVTRTDTRANYRRVTERSVRERKVETSATITTIDYSHLMIHF